MKDVFKFRWSQTGDLDNKFKSKVRAEIDGKSCSIKSFGEHFVRGVNFVAKKVSNVWLGGRKNRD